MPKDITKFCWNDNFKHNDYRDLIDTIGNLCLLSQPLNSEAKNHCYSVKIETYNRTNLLSVKNISKSKLQEKKIIWTPETIKERTESLLDFARAQWSDL